MDFTLNTYRRLLNALIAQGYRFQPFAEFLENPADKAIILRHDVEARYANALVMAQIQHQAGIIGTYYFRFLPNHFDLKIIREIARLGHEIGYHYDDLSHCHGDYEAAIRRFEKNLATLREISTVKTICMEGAPLSKYDNRELWSRQSSVISRQSPVLKSEASSGSVACPEERSEFGISRLSRRAKRVRDHQSEVENRNPELNTQHLTLNTHYSDYGIIGEPYFDLDFNDVLYLTDTGRRWDGAGVSVRDKVSAPTSPPSPPSPLFPLSNLERGPGGEVSDSQRGTGGRGVKGARLHSTSDIIAAAGAGLLPDRIMFTFHPQRWTDRPLPWLQELVLQNVKNIVKRWVVRRRV